MAGDLPGLAKVVFLDFDLDRVHSAAKCSDEVPSFIGHDLLRKVRDCDVQFPVVGLVNWHWFANGVYLGLRTARKQDLLCWKRSCATRESPPECVFATAIRPGIVHQDVL